MSHVLKVHMGFLWDLRFLPKNMLICGLVTKLPLGVNKCVNMYGWCPVMEHHPIQGVFQSHT